MHWSIAIALAKDADDLTYQEWCDLYVNQKNPQPEQIKLACETAHPILVRHRCIEPSVVFDQRIREEARVPTRRRF